VDPEFLSRLNRLWTLHSPANFDLKILKDRVLVIAARGDKVCPFAPVEELCARWGWPRHVFLTGGHWLMAVRAAGAGPGMNFWRRWGLSDLIDFPGLGEQFHAFENLMESTFPKGNIFLYKSGLHVIIPEREYFFVRSQHAKQKFTDREYFIR